jgi:hypothetical protein
MRVVRSSPAREPRSPQRRLVTRVLRAGAAVIAGIVLLMVIVVFLNPAGLQRAVTVIEGRWGAYLYGFDKPLADQISIYIGEFLREAGDETLDIPQLVIDIPFKGMEKIQAKRQEALDIGKLVQGEDDFVKAEIRFEGRTLPVKLRLKGDFNDHLMGRKWSFRVHVRKGEHLLGMRRFSIQSPVTRDFQGEILFFDTVRKFGVMVPNYSFVDVTLNGESMGVMALEESFSKELLERSRRREGVIVRFDESMVWASTDSAWGENNGWEGAFDHYRNAAVDSFGSSGIAESPVLTKQYKVAVGLLRGFVAQELTASEVFDAEQMGRLMAVSDLFGSWHALAWHNMRFYLNPVTLKLEPIAYDATLQRRIEGNRSVLNDDPFLQQIIKDPAVFAVYQKTLYQLATLVRSGRLLEDLRAAEEQPLKVLRTEFRLLPEFPLDYIVPRIEELLKKYGEGDTVPQRERFQFAVIEQNKYPILARARLLEEPQKRLELTNVVPKEVEVVAVEWVSDDSDKRYRIADNQLPILMPARGIGSMPEHWFVNVGEAPAEGEWYIEAVVRYRDRPWVRRVRAYTSYAPLDSTPIPAGSIPELLSAHSFIEVDPEASLLTIPAGVHRVEGQLVVPRGYSLRVSAGTTIEFAEDAVLIAHADVQINGTVDAPVIFQGIAGGRWKGLMVMNAESRSRVEHWIVRDTTSIVLDNWTLTGGINFYASDVDILNCRFEESHGEDALNIIHADYTIDGTVFSGTASDAFDSDFSVGTVVRSRFEAVGRAGGGDAVDVSGSSIVVTDSEFEDISDKALSVGEKSEMEASNIRMRTVGTGAASKDGSILRLSDTVIEGASFAGFTAYIKKPEYGPARIEAQNVKIAATSTEALAQTGSVVVIDGEAIEASDVNVDALYETIMRKGLR